MQYRMIPNPAYYQVADVATHQPEYSRENVSELLLDFQEIDYHLHLSQAFSEYDGLVIHDWVTGQSISWTNVFQSIASICIELRLTDEEKDYW